MYLLMSEYKYEHNWALIGKDTIWDDKKVRLLGKTTDSDLIFDGLTSEVCSGANQKLSILSKMKKVPTQNQRHIIFKSFHEPPFT